MIQGRNLLDEDSKIDRGSGLDSSPALCSFLSVYMCSLRLDEKQALESFMSDSTPDRLDQITQEVSDLLNCVEFPVDELEVVMNRYFATEADGRSWLEQLSVALTGGNAEWSVPLHDSPTRPDEVALQLKQDFPIAWKFFEEAFTSGETDCEAVSSIAANWNHSQVLSLCAELRSLAAMQDLRIDRVEDASDLFFESRQDFLTWIETITVCLRTSIDSHDSD